MHAAGPRALRSPAAGNVASRLATTCRRSFHQSRPTQKSPTDGSGSADGGKPSGKAETEEKDSTNKRENTNTSVNSESTTRRSRGSPFAAARQRQVRTRVAEELPPVALPRSFGESNIVTRTAAERTRTLRKDPLWHPGHIGSLWHDWLQLDLVLAFEAASWEDAETLKQTIAGLDDSTIDIVSRQISMIGCLASYLDSCLELKWPRSGEPSTLTPQDFKNDRDAVAQGDEAFSVVSKILGPIQRHSSYGQGKFTRESRKASREHVEALFNQIRNYILEGDTDKGTETPKMEKGAEALDELPDAYFIESHRTRMFDPNLLGELAASLRAELSIQAQEKWDRKELKRPVIVVNMTDYNGSYPASKLLPRMAAQVDATLLRLDAQDLASIVGGYLGQDTAFSKGSMSMLAYRVAELNGRLVKGTETSQASEEEMSGDIEAAWVNIRQQATNGSFKSPMEEELQKIKDDARDYVLPSVDRWENLKINAALEQMINAAANKSPNPDQPLIVQLDNFVELSMTLEGALLLGRIRGIVDSMWKEGKKIVLVGTSASRDPPEQFASALREISSEENVFNFSLRRGDIEGVEAKLARREVLDYVQENLRNVQIMLRSVTGELGTDSEAPMPHLSDDITGKIKVDTRISSSFISAVMKELNDSSVNLELYPSHFTSSILPNADVYHLARILHGSSFDGDTELINVVEHFFRTVRSRLISSSAGQADPAQDKHASSNSQATSKQKAEPERVGSGGKYNDIEKKLLAGLVDVNEIKTTFADVHAPKDTIAALKLLTSLSLARPDAFTYGILAKDKIPGCLLYGPPGTGKTLLAKAVAKESGASMLEVSGASINDMYVGQSEKNVRALFSLAKKLSPLVIFIDEADALFAARSQSKARPSHRETINQFLREWDGMSDMKAFIMVATNRPFDLDDAVLRRLPRKILVDLPMQADRAAILNILLKDERLEDAVNIEEISKQTVLYSGSDLKNLCVAAAMSAVQEEMEDAKRHEGPEPYVYPERRTLAKRHFDKAAKEIAASISEDMDSLQSIRKFDQKYGDQRAKRSKPRGMGFGVIPGATDAEDARVRQPIPE